MNTFNNFSPLAFREKSQKDTYKKWYAYGKEFALPFSTTELPPFQFTVTNLPSFNPTTVEVFLVNEATGVRYGTGIKIKVDTMDGHNSVLYVSPGSNVYAKSIEPGVYRAEFAIPEGETYVSTPICVTDGIETNTNFVKLEYWNDEKLAYPNGFVTTGTDNDFKFQMYIPTTFFKPKYEFEEEITKRAGYKFLELQTCNKVFGFNFLAPEYICDALRLVRLSDYIRFTHDGEYYNALNFEYNPDWQDNGYLAAIECQFETDTIIQKLPSFNRRDRESFYNALLADIETPILFSPDTVGLYYREFKQGEPTIKGKLIRELSPIDLIDENTTIAVDMGAGEARKFNLYRMLEGYISKNHEDVTEFLLSLRGGVNIGTPNASGEYPASVDRDGNTKLKDIQGNDATLNKVTGKDATFKTVETGFLTVNKTSATIDGMGNANVTDLTARGDSMLRSDVYTGSKNGSPTGKITKEGQLQYLSAIIYEFLSSETFVPGFLGEGFKIWLENGNWNIECDNLTVRQTMNIFELLIQKIRSVNGAIVVSQSNGKVAAVEDTGTQYKITFGEEFPTFQEGDLIRCQSWSKNNLKFYWVEVKTAADGYVLCDKSEFSNVVPAVGDEVVQMGNTKNAERQALIYITAQESGKPYIEILNGVKTKSLTGTDRTRLGDLSNIVDPDFTGEAAVKGTGFYSTNAFLKGIFVLRNGKRVEDEIKIAKDVADQAAQDAANAAQSAQEAKNRLNKWADDGFISPTEKPALIDEGKRIQAEYLQIKANADKYGVLVTEYTEAYNNYLNELRYHSAVTPEDIAVRPELAQSQTTYYDKRNGALNAIANAAKDYVDEADKKLKEYLDTEITAIPGKIELSVRSLKVADTNILKGAYTKLNALAYAIGYYSYDVPVINGKEYTLTVCYTLSEANTDFSAYANGGTNYLCNFNTKGDKVIESKKVTMVGYKPTEGLHFYQFPQGTYGSKVHWAVLTDGNLGVTSWIPSASEKNVGLRNLCSFKRITDAGFTYAQNYEDDGSFYVVPGKLNEETNSANKDMFGLTYDPQKHYYIFIDSAIRSDTNLDKSSTFFIIKYTDGTEQSVCIVYPNKIDYNYIITQKPISKIVGSYGYGYGSTLRIGVYETNFPVSWSPAPEDQLYQSVKYTDTQILAVEGKIELKVSSTTYEEGLSKTQRISRYLSLGRMLPEYSDVCFSKGLNGLSRYNNAGTEGVRIHRSSIAGVPNNTGYSCTINTTLSRGDTAPGAGGFYFNNQARYGAMFLYKLVAAIPKGRILEFATNAIGDGSTREWLTSHVGTGKWEEYYYLVKCGTSGKLGGSGFFFIADKANVEWHLAYATVYDVFGDNSQINKTTYETKITQLESSISLKASQSDLNATTERVRQAEIKLDSTSIKLGVVEGTANDAKSTASSASSAASSAQSTANAAKSAAGAAQSTANAANSLAGTANNKADATNNGLVETGINITSRKIVLKSDNVLFQNNAGQQTAAINANGRLTANVIEAGEVVANGFAAQRITTGNLTVTDGAVIAGMTIAGGVLTGKNINITDGAKVGSFTISSGIFSAQEVPAGIQMTLSGNVATFDSSGVRVENNSGSYALTTTGKGKIFLTGSDFWVQCKDVDFMGAQTWKAPGVFYACTILANGAIGKTWGNPDFHITRVIRNSAGRYTVYTTGSNGDYFVMITGYNVTLWLSTTVEPYSEGEFTYKVFDVNKGMTDSAVIIYFCGMVR
nr:MAG TPA: tail protein [Bacteriophage sp.]